MKKHLCYKVLAAALALALCQSVALSEGADSLPKPIQALAEAWPAGSIGIVEVKEDGTNLREGPSADHYDIMGEANQGDTFYVVDVEQNGWFAVLLPNGGSAFISDNMVQYQERPPGTPDAVMPATVEDTQTEPKITKVVANGIVAMAAIDDNGMLHTWGFPDWMEPTENLPPLKDIAMSANCFIALDVMGGLHGWGVSSAGELDFLNEEDLPPCVAIDANGFYVIALTEDGKVLSWGTASHNQQVSIPPMPPIKKILTHGSTNAALDESGKVHCWGTSQLEVPITDTIDDIAILLSGVAAIGRDGKIYENSKPGDYTYKTIYIPRPDIANPAQIFSNGETIAVLDEAGKLYVWGSCWLEEGQAHIANIPTNLPPLVQVCFVSYNGIAAVGADGKVYQWGTSNAFEDVPTDIDGFAGKEPQF